MQNQDELVRRSKRTENFTIIGNDVIQDERMSIEARGVLIFILSLPENWVVRKNDLQKRLKISRRTIDRCFDEMKEYGYLCETDFVKKDGKFNGKGYIAFNYSIFKSIPLMYSTDAQGEHRSGVTDVHSEHCTDAHSEQLLKKEDIQEINNNNTGDDSNSSFPINPVNDNPEHLLEGGRAAAAPAEIDYRGLDESAKLWLQYKKEKKQTYKGVSSINAMVNKLWKFSKGSPEKAMEIVENSIAMNYQGFFEPKENNQSTSVQPVKANSNVKFNIQ
jgi:hypothetical protein